MQPIVTNRVTWYVDLSVAIVSPAKMSEPIDMPFGVWIRIGPRKHVLDGDAHRRNLANTIEPSVCCGDAAFSSNH